MEEFFLVGVHHRGDLPNKNNCKSGKLSSFNCLHFRFFKKGIFKKISKYKREVRRAGSQLFQCGTVLIAVCECLNF